MLNITIRRKGGPSSGWFAPPRGTHSGEKHRAVGSGKAVAGKAKPSALGNGKASPLLVSSADMAGTYATPLAESLQMMNSEEILAANISNLVDALHGRGISDSEVETFVYQWFETSNKGKSHSIQEAAAKEFGIKLSPWQAKISGEHIFANRDSPEADARATLRAMHTLSGEWFKEQGVKTVTIYRGASVPAGKTYKAGEHILLENQNALSSWSLGYSVAAGFGDAIVSMEVPVSRVLSMAVTGLGSLEELEFVVIGAEGDTATVQSVYT